MTTTVRESTHVRQKQIVSAARKLIVEYGSEHVTVRRIANEVRVSEGALYRHFKSKRDVLSFLVDDIEETLMADIDISPGAAGNPLDILGQVAQNYMSSVQQRKGVAFQVVAEIISLGDQKLNIKVYKVINNYISRIQDLLSVGIQAGVVRSDIDLTATATLFFSMIQGLVNLWALSHYSFDLQSRHNSVWNVFREAVIKR